MGRRLQQQEYREALNDIVVTLLALALLAEGATCRSLVGRWLLFPILRMADARARGFAVQTLQRIILLPVIDGRDSRSDALGLAAGFRALAAAFRDLSLALWRTALGRSAAPTAAPPAAVACTHRVVVAVVRSCDARAPPGSGAS